MAKKHWKERFNDGGICDFKKNYDFYFKWLLSKTCSCVYIKNLPETLDEFYIKSTLFVDGDICISDFDGKLYACIGAPGGEPNEYYAPTIYTIANPVLGSKMVKIGQDGVVIYNTPLDKYIPGGLSGLIDQTATLLADNVISINSNQINSRVAAIFTADSDAQAAAGEAILKKMYAGAPYMVIRSDLIEKIGINPIATANVSANLTELVELNNYIIANYFQSIGIRSNNIRKKSHLLQDEVDIQNDYLQLSILEIITSWQKGFDEVNEKYGTNIQVELNPALMDTLLGGIKDDEPVDTDIRLEETGEPEMYEEQTPESDGTEQTELDTTEETPEPVKEETDLKEELLENEECVEDLIDVINDNVEEEVTQEDEEPGKGEDME